MDKTDNKASKNEAPEYRPLYPFIGKWNTHGNAKAGKGEPDVKIEGTDTYEWVAGGAFVLHTVDVTMGAERKESIEVIGFEKSTNKYFMRSYDDAGEITEMIAEFGKGTIRFLSDDLRFTGSFSDDEKVLSGVWEQRNNEKWEPLMDIKLSKS